MMAALAFEIENRVDQMLDRLWSCDLPIFGDMTDEQKRRAARLGVAHEIERRRAHLRDGAGCGFERRRPDRLDGIDGDDAGRFAAVERGENVLDTGRRAQRHRRLADAHARRAEAHLRHRLFAGDVDRMAARCRVGRQRLQDQRRFADTRIAAHEQRRARHESAARHAIEFGNAGDAARRRFVFGFQVFKREGTSARGPAATCASGKPRTFFGDRIPAAAGLALAGPFGVRGAAGLADESLLEFWP